MNPERDEDFEPWPEADPLGVAFSQVFAVVFEAWPVECPERKVALCTAIEAHSRLRELLNRQRLN
jgi:hypothetical protein